MVSGAPVCVSVIHNGHSHEWVHKTVQYRYAHHCAPMVAHVVMIIHVHVPMDGVVLIVHYQYVQHVSMVVNVRMVAQQH